MEYYSPKSIKELLELIDKYKAEAAIAAGCTDILVKQDFFKNKKAIIDITSIKELKNIENIGNKTRIGAGITFSNLIQSKIIQQEHQALYQAAKVYGSLQIRNRGTIAGNIVNASPAADSVPPLMVSNAKLILLSKSGEEYICIRDFFTGPGKTILKPEQIVAYIEIEKDNTDTISFYRKIGTRKALSIAKASVAFKAKKNDGRLTDVHFAYGSVGPTVIYSTSAREYLEGKALDNKTIEEASLKAFDEVAPINDIRSTAEYRKLVVKNVLIEELKLFA